MVEYFCVLNRKNTHKSLEGFTELSGVDYYVGIQGKCKFERDCIFEENSQILVMLIGVVFNKSNLIIKSKKESWFQTIIDLYFQNGDTFFNQLSGSFNGIIFDKLTHKWLIFSNIQSERPIFLSKSKEELIIASNIRLIQKDVSINNCKLTLNIDGAYMLLSHGYMLNGNTLFNEVKRIKASYYCIFDKGNLQEKKHYDFNNTDITTDSQKDIINNIDSLFIEAVKQQFEKDREYGFRHITFLSGGLDSRMTVFCAHELGYRDQVNNTFSQSNYLDETIACQIAAKLKHEWIFKALDNGLFLYDLEKITEITGGNVLYYGVAHGFSMFSLLNFEGFGMMHSGQLGGAILNWNYSKHRKPSIYDGALSKNIAKKIPDNIINIEDYENEELFMINNKYLNGTNFGLSGILNFTESFSPFYNLNFWEYCLKIPLRLRYNRHIYKQWIIEKHPLAAEFKYDRTGVRINNNQLRDKLRLYYNGRVITFEDAISGLYRQAARKLNINYKPSLKGMNPIESWLILNKELKIFFNDYFRETIFLLDNHPELKSDCIDLFNNGSAQEKVQVLSLLSAVKLFI